MDEPVRIDKWLWAARLAKTRPLAAEAVSGGKVHLNGKATKPSKDVKPGDRIEITVGQNRKTVDIVALAERRGPAAEAERLYEETPESQKAREDAAAQRRLNAHITPDLGGRPTKRDRRRFDRARGSRDR